MGEDLPLDQGRATELANFQLDAVKQALNMIAAHGGCYIGDVVGLGKTYIGAETLRQLRVTYPNDGPPLIICPPGLIPMWRYFNERFALGAEVISHAVISAPPDPEFDEESGRYLDEDGAGTGVVLEDTYPNRGPVLVDEAHNFRNVNRRSRGLRHYLGIRQSQGRAAQRNASEPRPPGHLPPDQPLPRRRGSRPRHRAGQPA